MNDLVTWFTDHRFQLLTTNNFTAVGLMSFFIFVILGFLIQRWNTISIDMKMMGIGVMLTDLGWVIQRAYYGFFNLYKIEQDDKMVAFLLQFQWISIVCGVMVMTGLSLMVAPALTFLRKGAGRTTNYIGSFLMVVAVWWFIFLKIDIDHYF